MYLTYCTALFNTINSSFNVYFKKNRRLSYHYAEVCKDEAPLGAIATSVQVSRPHRSDAEFVLTLICHVILLDHSALPKFLAETEKNAQ